MHFSARKFYRLGSEGVNCRVMHWLERDNNIFAMKQCSNRPRQMLQITAFAAMKPWIDRLSVRTVSTV